MKKLLLNLSILLYSIALTGQHVVINEVLARNVSAVMDETGNFSDFIELYNPGATSFTFSGIYLSDDPGRLFKYKIQDGVVIGSKKFLVIWCDNQNKPMHANFRIDPDGETLYMSSVALNIIDSVKIGKQCHNISYGRYPDGSDTWRYFITHTAGKINNTAMASEQLKKVKFDRKGGIFYSGKQTVSMTAEAGTKIYYTRTGAEPTQSSLLYSGPVSSDTSFVLRARAFADGYLPSEITTETYITNVYRNINLPVICVTADPKFLWDDIIGIYVYGTNGIMGNGTTVPANFNQDWERPVNFEFYDMAKKQQVNMQAGTKISGAYSRKNGEKTIAIYGDEKYGGNGKFEYQFFNQKSNLTEQSFLLRNSGNDWNNTMLRDGFIQTLIQNKIDIDYMSFQPAVMFLNGRYWGIHNIRERPGSEYLWSNYHIDKDSIDILEWGTSVVNGTNTHYKNMIDYMKANDMSLPVHYNYICTQMDVNEYMNYIITQCFIANTDWPGNNNKYWHPQRPGARWRWMLYDTDISTGIWGKPASFNMIEWITKVGGTSGANQDWATYLPRTLLVNPAYKKMFIDHFAVYLGTLFRSDRTTHILDSCKNNIITEMPSHVTRWGSSTSSWNNNMTALRNWMIQRPDYAYQHLQQYFGLGVPGRLNIHSSVNGASFAVNDIIVDDTVFEGCYFLNSMLSIRPLAPSGYKFKEWKVSFTNNAGGEYISKGSTWKYLDNGTNQGSAWQAAGFDDAAWKSGMGELGYGDGDEKTIISYGPDAGNRYITYYFRKKFTITDTTNLNLLKLNLIVDDGALVYLNGAEIMRINMPAGAVAYNTLSAAGAENFNAVDTLDKNMLIIGENIIAVEVHQQGPTSSDVSFDLSMPYEIKSTAPNDTTITNEIIADTMRYGMNLTAYWDADTASKKDIRINEICADNSKEKDEFGQADDWIELYNPNDTAVDIGGMFLTDSLPCPTRYRIPPGFSQFTTIPAKGYLRLWADEQYYQGKLHLDFKFERFGEQAGLCYKKGEQIVWLDSITFRYQDDLYSFGRYTDGTPSWQYMPVTPAKTNLKGYVIDTGVKKVVINELSAQNNTVADETGATNDWIELYNPGADTVDVAGMLLTDTLGFFGLSRIPYGFNETKMAPKDYLVLWCDNNSGKGPLHIDIQLDRMGEQLGIAQMLTNKTVWADTITFGYQDNLYSYGRYKDGDSLWMYMPMTPDSSNKQGFLPGTAIKNILINEICAANNSFADEYGQTNDWIELYNPTGDTVDIAGMILTDNSGLPGGALIPYGYPAKTRIAPHGFVLLWCDDVKNHGPLHLDVKLNKNGETIGLFQMMYNGNFMTDTISYPVQQSDTSYGRYTDGMDSLFYMPLTPGAANAKLPPPISLSAAEGFYLYPNPATTVIYLGPADIDNSNISVISMQGIVVLEKKAAGNPVEINIQQLPQGIYVIRIQNEEGIRQLRFIKQ